MSEVLGLLKLAEDVGNWASSIAAVTPAEPAVEPTGRHLNAAQRADSTVANRLCRSQTGTGDSPPLRPGSRLCLTAGKSMFPVLFFYLNLVLLFYNRRLM